MWKFYVGEIYFIDHAKSNEHETVFREDYA
jgi:hypothetical protein